MITVDVLANTLVVDIKDQKPTVNVDAHTITLDVESGGLVATSQDLTLTAGENLSALRAVTTNASGEAVYATNTSLANAQVVGVTMSAASAGGTVGVKTFGTMTDASWNWTKGAIYLGTNGVLTQTAPTGGNIIVHVARALTATMIFVDTDTFITTI